MRYNYKFIDKLSIELYPDKITKTVIDLLNIGIIRLFNTFIRYRLKQIEFKSFPQIPPGY